MGEKCKIIRGGSDEVVGFIAGISRETETAKGIQEFQLMESR